MQPYNGSTLCDLGFGFAMHYFEDVKIRHRTFIVIVGGLAICLMASCVAHEQLDTPLSTEVPVPTEASTPHLVATLSGPDLDMTKVAPFTPEYQTAVAAATEYAIATPIPRTFPPMPTPVPNTPEPGLHGCGGADRFFDLGSCWSGRTADEYLFVNTGVPRANPSEGTVWVITSTLDQREHSPVMTYTTPIQVGQIDIAHVNWPSVTLIALHDNAPSTTFVFNLLTRTWEQPGPCELYPIAPYTSMFTGAQGRFDVRNATYGTASGNFGWLNWTGNTVSDTLATSLTPPGDSATYVNPNDPTDHTPSIGDWVAGHPEVSNDTAVANTLSSLSSSDIRFVVPLWDQVTGQGGTLRYRIGDFAWASVEEFSVLQPNTITLRYWGQAQCPAAP